MTIRTRRELRLLPATIGFVERMERIEELGYNVSLVFEECKKRGFKWF